jgi:hypothetical protein
MAESLSGSMHSQTVVLDHLVLILHDHRYTIITVAVLAVAVFSLKLRRRQHKPSPDIEAWVDDEKACVENEKDLDEITPSLSTLLSEYSHPLSHSLFQQAGIPSSGDIARRQSYNTIGASYLNSGDIAVPTPSPSADARQHPWRRHSHPQPPSYDHLTGSQNEVVIREDVVDFFKDDAIGKLWRRRTLEFGSPTQAT